MPIFICRLSTSFRVLVRFGSQVPWLLEKEEEGLYRLRPRAWFVTKEQNQALVEPLGPNTTNFQSLSPRFTLLTELNQALV